MSYAPSFLYARLKVWPTRPVVVDPLLPILSLALIALLTVSLGLSEEATALVVIGFFLLCVLLSPTNGLILLFLLPPLFNGEDQRPFFFLLEILVYLTLFAGFTAHLWRRRLLVFPYAAFFTMFLISTVISLPLDLEETWLQVQVSSWREILEGIRRSDLAAGLFYVRTVLNVASGIGLYVLVVNQRWTRDTILRLAVAATVLYAAVTSIGLWFYWFPPRHAKTFLTLWLGGELTGGFTGFGFNVSYFAQYALTYLPLVALVLVARLQPWTQGLAFSALLVSGYTLLITYQRGAYVVFALELALLLVVGLALGQGRWSAPVTVVLGVAVVTVLLIVLGLLIATPVRSVVFTRIIAIVNEGDPVRTHLLQSAWQMFLDHPLLGIGSGRFAHFFQFYSPRPSMQFGSWSIHNVYVQFLAEQGAFGLASFLSLLAIIVGHVIRAQRRLNAERPAALFLLISLTSWLVYGLHQYTFLMRSMQIYFWITLGLLVSLTPTGPSRRLLGRRTIMAIAAISIVTLGIRAYAVVSRPVPPHYVWGLHGVEIESTQWTRGGAVLNLPVEGRVLRLAFACPIPQVTSRPQEVFLSLDGARVAHIILDTPAWKTIELPVDKRPGSSVLLQLRVGYTFIPAAFGINDDTRRLGVLMKPIEWRTE